MNSVSAFLPSPVAATHCVHRLIWLDIRTSAAPSSRDDSMRADDARLKKTDISPLHLLAWKAVHAVSTVVTDSTTTANSSRRVRRRSASSPAPPSPAPPSAGAASVVG